MHAGKDMVNADASKVLLKLAEKIKIPSTEAQPKDKPKTDEPAPTRLRHRRRLRLRQGRAPQRRHKAAAVSQAIITGRSTRLTERSAWRASAPWRQAPASIVSLIADNSCRPPCRGRPALESRAGCPRHNLCDVRHGSFPGGDDDEISHVPIGPPDDVRLGWLSPGSAEARSRWQGFAVSPTTDNQEQPDIHNGIIVWQQLIAQYGDYDICVADLNNPGDPLFLTIAMPTIR